MVYPAAAVGYGGNWMVTQAMAISLNGEGHQGLPSKENSADGVN